MGGEEKEEETNLGVCKKKKRRKRKKTNKKNTKEKQRKNSHENDEVDVFPYFDSPYMGGMGWFGIIMGEIWLYFCLFCSYFVFYLSHYYYGMVMG